MEIFYHRYTLSSSARLNSRSERKEHEGALIRIGDGYGCLHPWPELGDPSLDSQLEDLKTGQMSRQLRALRRCIEVDGEARHAGVNLFSGLEVPRSHATIVGGREEVELALSQGFETVKLKVGRDVEAECALIKELHQDYPELRFRLDFNGVLGGEAVERYVLSLGNEVWPQIDFLEDPCSVNDGCWLELRELYGIPLAVDEGVAEARDHFGVAVIKPALNNVEKICDREQASGRSVVITSYMDHPLGQAYAAYMAGTMSRQFLGLIDPLCGLMTHGLFEPTPFSEALGAMGPEWNAPEGTGLGFDTLLGGLEWKRL